MEFVENSAKIPYTISHSPSTFTQLFYLAPISHKATTPNAAHTHTNTHCVIARGFFGLKFRNVFIFGTRSPYSFPDPTGSDVTKAMINAGRVADVWMDEYGELFLRRFPVVRRATETTGEFDIDERRRLREQLQCHNFSWYAKTSSSPLW